MYVNICLYSNPEAIQKGELKDANLEVPSVYVGETARSIQERAKEHWDGFRAKDDNNHIYKHWVLHHGSVGVPKFIMKVVKFHRSALSRQVGEAIRIHKRGTILNSKSEYNRCKITRLSLGVELQDQQEDHQQDGDEGVDQDWTASLRDGRDRADREERQSLGRLIPLKGAKRKDDSVLPDVRRRKKLKYQRLEEDWGMTGKLESGNSTFLYSGLEGIRNKSTDLAKPKPKYKPMGVAAYNVKEITDWLFSDKSNEPEVTPSNMRKEEQLVLAITWEGMRRLAIGYAGGGTPLRRSGYDNLAITWDKTTQLALGWCGSTSKNQGVASQGKVVTSGKPARNKRRRVWTKLGSGLFAWRAERGDTGNKLKTGSEYDEQGPQLTKAGKNKRKYFGGDIGAGRESESFQPMDTDLEGDYCMKLKTKKLRKE